VNTTAAAVPRRARSAAACLAAAPGTAMIATSGTSGNASTDGKQGNPWISARFGLTGMMRPAKPQRRM
jgi:hypothetical protein